MAMISRRGLLGGVAAGSAAWLARSAAHGRPGQLPLKALGPPVTPRSDGRDVDILLDAEERQIALPCFEGRAMPLWTFADGGWPTVRLRLGDRLVARVKNRLPRQDEHISIHWHGIRLPNNEDGVPYMTQAPIVPGGEFTYHVVPPDAGSYFFHTHCNTVEHLGRGLLGLLIVDGDETAPYDHDLALVMKDWRIGSDGQFLPFMTDAGAAKAGSPGTPRSVNGADLPRIELPASADVRLRLFNVDAVRFSEIGIKGADAAVVAVDGVACPPFPLKSWRMGPAMRLDIVIRSPRPGASAHLVDFFAPEPVQLAELVGTGAPRRRSAFDPAPLRASRIAEPDLARAERVKFAFSATASGDAVAELPIVDGIDIGALCLTSRTYWAINKQAWPGTDHSRLGPPLAELKLGQTYLFELENLTPHPHPIHIHGHTFTFVSSNKRGLPPHKADTVALLPRERIEVAFVADNPGLWMFHCHILEHQETGMMGYLKVA